MNKTLPAWAYGLLCTAGVVLVASMFVNWVDVMGHSATGFSLAWNESKWLFLVPLVGGVLAATAAARSEATRLAAVAAGLCVSGYVLFSLGDGVLRGGAATWLMFGGAGAMIAGTRKTARAWRAIGGLAVLAGFFAPWADHSLWDVMRSGLAGGFLRMLWLVPLAGLAGLGCALSSHAKAGRLSLAAGLAVFGAFAWVLGSAANMVFAWGAWAAFGASALALVIGVLAPAGAASLPPAKASKV